ncbi:hypothetical protein MMC11_006718 [Xylographa trunciseda]|nr:hypothetical protein [Xylographa trunciseda]
MVEGAEDADLEPERLAHLELTGNLAGLHTTSMAIPHAIHDLCEHPKYVKVLCEEIEEVFQDDGRQQKNIYNKLHKLDSFLKESQRFSPPTLCSSTLSSPYPLLAAITTSECRAVVFPSTLQPRCTHITDSSNSLKIPVGIPLTAAFRSILFDPEVRPGPDDSDGLRYYRRRGNSPEGHEQQFASVAGTNMNFGAGQYACLGRIFASMELELLLVHLHLKFDSRFPPGCGRPSLLVVEELGAVVYERTPWCGESSCSMTPRIDDKGVYAPP